MKTRYIIASLLIAASGLTSCNSFLDIDPTDQASDKLVWSNTKYAELAINYFYADIPYLGSFSSYQCLAGLTEGMTDEFKYGNMNYNAECYIPNEISYGGIVLTPSYTDTYMGVWETTYEEIRRVNEALAKLKSSSFDESVKKQYEGELRFFRGMYYFELLKRYGQAIIYDDDLSKITTDHALNTADDCWNYVYEDLLYAGQNLPNSTTNNGRLTSGAAYALMSRAMLYCKNWKAVKEAAEAVTSMGYKLTANYADAFKASGNTEAIYMYSYSADASVTHNFDGYYAPGGDHKKAGMTMYGGYGTPTQDMVEEYEKADGSKVDWSTWHTTEGTLENPPYDELEPRFQATILYNGASWRKRTIEPYVDGTDGWATWKTDAVTEGRTTTGYYLRKLVDENHDFSITQNSTQPWVAFRLAEVLLNEAEACHNLGDDTKAVELINQVRSRVGLPGIKSYSDEALRHERKVELAYEGLYYWDMRRWGLATSAFTGIRRHGLKIEKLAEGKFRYTYVDVDDENLNYPAKMNRLPIPEKELNNNKDIEQFSEWK